MSSALILPQTITGIGSFSALTWASADWLAIDPARCSIPGQGEARTTVENKSGADSVFVEDAFEGAQILTLVGDLVVTSTGLSSEGTYFAAVSTLLGSLKTALAAMKTADANLVHSGGSTACRWYTPLEPTWINYWVCSVTFGLLVHV